jgi:VanZ family protein
MHRSSAWPLALLYAGLIIYASLYPFAEWRDQGIAPWEFLAAPNSRYWTGFDVGINVVGYGPLGALLAIAVLRTERWRYPLLVATMTGLVLSLLMETIQSYLPSRVPSREDFLLNSSGAFCGGGLALLLERWGVLDRWSRVRARWFVQDARGGIVLLALWPAALLFPAAIPLGLGQVLVRLEDALVSLVWDTPLLEWLPLHSNDLQPLAPGLELLCVAFGLLIPCLLGFCVVRVVWRRLVLVAFALVAAVAVTALSAALTWGPVHAWAWLDQPALLGLASGAVLAAGMVILPWRACAAVLLLILGIYLNLLNQAPESPYFAQALQDWEQGRFIRFHGVAQWLGWLWPYAAVLYVMGQIVRREPHS